MSTSLRVAAFFLTAGLTAGLIANLVLFQQTRVGSGQQLAKSQRDADQAMARARAGSTAPLSAQLPSAVQATDEPPITVTSAAQAIEIARSIQVALKTKGYAPGPADGVPGLMTRAALMAFEHDHGLALSADVTQKRLEMLIYGVPENLKHQGALASLQVGPIARDVIRTVQGSLKTVGYDTGPVDGTMSLQMSRAISEFEADQGLAETGRISGKLMAKLVSMASQGKLALHQ
ncbi:MAG: peptidoglycan-binding domain-containing protein [Pseudomonadota bacterium]